MEKILNAIDNNQLVIDIIHLQDYIFELSKSRQNVNETSIKNCFLKKLDSMAKTTKNCEEEEELLLFELKKKWEKFKECMTLSEDAKFENHLEIDKDTISISRICTRQHIQFLTIFFFFFKQTITTIFQHTKFFFSICK